MTVVCMILLFGIVTDTVEVGTQWTDPGATAIDNYDGNISGAITVTGSVDTAVLGEYVIRYSVADSSGNVATAERVVKVVDRTPPVITLVGAAVMTVRWGRTFADPGAVAVDNYDGAVSGRIVRTGRINTRKLGTQVLLYDVSDLSGNKASTVRRTVRVTL